MTLRRRQRGVLSLVQVLVAVAAVAVPAGAVYAVGSGADTVHVSEETPPIPLPGVVSYDVKDGYLVLFGDTLGRSGQTWTYANDTWTDITATAGAPPLAQVGYSMAYDTRDGYVVLFGGLANGYGDLNQTWTFSGGKWTEIFPVVSPSPREYASMTFNAHDWTILLFGGNGAGGAYTDLNDTWTFAAGEWHLIPTSTAPFPRQEAMMAYDALSGYVVLFGGESYSAGGGCEDQTSPDASVWYCGDTWTYRNHTWALDNPAEAPGARIGSIMTFDKHNGYMVLYGGCACGSSGQSYNDSWKFIDGVWTLLGNPLVPSPGGAEGEPQVAAYDPQIHKVVYFEVNSWWFVDQHWELAP